MRGRGSHRQRSSHRETRTDRRAAHALPRHQAAGAVGDDVTVTELGAEALQQADLIVVELDLALADVLLEPEKPLVPGRQLVTSPNACDTLAAHLDALQRQLLRYTECTVGGVVKAMGQDGVFDLLGTRLGWGALAPGNRSIRPSAP